MKTIGVIIILMGVLLITCQQLKRKTRKSKYQDYTDQWIKIRMVCGAYYNYKDLE